ncbi:MAG: rod shape-determining protein RodA [Gemmatimonadota bacterium]
MSRRGLDRGLLTAVGALLIYGLLVLYSAGQTDAPTDAAGAWVRQLIWIGLGVVTAFVVFRFSFRFLEWAAPMAYIIGLLVLLLTLAIGTGAGSAAGTRSWITIGGLRLGQPVEFAKLATILMLARYLSAFREPPESLRALLPASLIAGVPAVLVLLQPDLGSAIVFAGILFGMLYWAGVRPFLLLLLASPVLSLVLAIDTTLWGAWMVALFVIILLGRAFVTEGIAIYLINSAMGVLAIVLWDKLKPYQQKRLTTFLNPEIDPAAAGYQAIQSRVAVGSGGWFGHGLTQGPQKRLAFLPEQGTDFVFSIVGEELGFVGVLLALALFFFLLVCLIRIARRATEPFTSMVVFGIMALLLSHIFENVGMTVSLTPITGIPLPFFSYGGSFLLALSVAIGLCLRAAWDARLAGYADM